MRNMDSSQAAGPDALALLTADHDKVAKMYKEFQRLDPGVPIIAMSGVMFRESSQRHAPDFLGMAGKLGATRTLHKPFKPAELMEAVEACGEVRAQQFDARMRRAAAGVRAK